LWVRAESRPNEDRVGIMPEGVAQLAAQGMTVTVEESPRRIIPTDAYAAAGAGIAPQGSWPTAPDDAIIFGLKELPEDAPPCVIATSCSAMPLRTNRQDRFCCAGSGQEAGRYMIWNI
jgi:hypothetical protein